MNSTEKMLLDSRWEEIFLSKALSEYETKKNETSIPSFKNELQIISKITLNEIKAS